MINVLSLFAGVGGIDLGLERTGGFRTVAFCEVDAKCRLVLSKHWPGVPQYDDVRTLTGARLAADGIAVDGIVGGFPCQDISSAGAGAGIDGDRSILWFEYARLIGEIRPTFVLVENVSALLARGFDRVLGSLAALGYDAEWHCIPASAVGAPHRRDRIWIVAHPNGAGLEGHGAEHGLRQDREEIEASRISDVPDAASIGPQGSRQPDELGDPAPPRLGQTIELVDGRIARQWAVEPNVGRVAHGVPGRVDRLKQLGNAAVPQIPEIIGNAWIAMERVHGRTTEEAG